MNTRRFFLKASVSALVGLQFLRPLEFVSEPLLTEAQIVALELERISLMIPALYDIESPFYTMIKNLPTTTLKLVEWHEAPFDFDEEV